MEEGRNDEKLCTNSSKHIVKTVEIHWKHAENKRKNNWNDQSHRKHKFQTKKKVYLFRPVVTSTASSDVPTAAAAAADFAKILLPRLPFPLK